MTTSIILEDAEKVALLKHGACHPSGSRAYFQQSTRGNTLKWKVEWQKPIAVKWFSLIFQISNFYGKITYSNILE